MSADIVISRVLPQKTKNCDTIYFDLRLNHRYHRDTKRLMMRRRTLVTLVMS